MQQAAAVRASMIGAEDLVVTCQCFGRTVWAALCVCLVARFSPLRNSPGQIVKAEEEDVS